MTFRHLCRCWPAVVATLVLAVAFGFVVAGILEPEKDALMNRYRAVMTSGDRALIQCVDSVTSKMTVIRPGSGEVLAIGGVTLEQLLGVVLEVEERQVIVNSQLNGLRKDCFVKVRYPPAKEVLAAYFQTFAGLREAPCPPGAEVSRCFFVDGWPP